MEKKLCENQNSNKRPANVLQTPRDRDKEGANNKLGAADQNATKKIERQDHKNVSANRQQLTRLCVAFNTTSGIRKHIANLLHRTGRKSVTDVALVHRPASKDEGRGRRERVQVGRHVLSKSEHVRGRVVRGRHANGGKCRPAGHGCNGARATDGAHLAGRTHRRHGHGHCGVDECHFERGLNYASKGK